MPGSNRGCVERANPREGRREERSRDENGQMDRWAGEWAKEDDQNERENKFHL